MHRLSVIPLAVTLLTSLPACTESEGASEVEARPELPVGSPQTRDVRIERAYVADVRAARHAEVRSRLKGILEVVGVDEGQAVKAGQALFTINARVRKQEVEVSRAAVLGAQAELEAAELEVQNVQLLKDKNVVSEAEVARARSKVRTARARVEQAKATAARAGVELDYAQMRAPFDGVVNRLPYKAGTAIGEDDLLTTITDTREVLAYFAIAEREYLEDMRAQGADTRRAAVLELADGSRFEHAGTIDAVSSELDAATGTITYRARFPNPKGLVRHGSSGKVILESTIGGALVIPQKATFEVQGDVYVYVVDAAAIARARKIDVRARVEDVFVVGGGLKRDERIVLEGIQKVRDGMRVVQAGS